MSANASFEFRIPSIDDDNNNHELFYSLFRTILNHVMFTRTLVPLPIDDIFTKYMYLLPSPQSETLSSSCEQQTNTSHAESNNECNDIGYLASNHMNTKSGIDANSSNANNMKTNTGTYQLFKRLSSSERKMKQFLTDYHRIITIIQHLFTNASSSLCDADDNSNTLYSRLYTINECRMSIKNSTSSSHPKESFSISFPSIHPHGLASASKHHHPHHHQQQQQHFSNNTTRFVSVSDHDDKKQQQQQQQYYCRQLTRRLLSEWSDFYLPIVTSSHTNHISKKRSNNSGSSSGNSSKSSTADGILIKTMMSKLFLSFRITLLNNNDSSNSNNSSNNNNNSNNHSNSSNKGDEIHHIMTQLRSIPYFSDYFCVISSSSSNNNNHNHCIRSGNRMSIYSQQQLNDLERMTNENAAVYRDSVSAESTATTSSVSSSSSSSSNPSLLLKLARRKNTSSSLSSPDKSVVFALISPPPSAAAPPAMLSNSSGSGDRSSSKSLMRKISSFASITHDDDDDDDDDCEGSSKCYCFFDIVSKKPIQSISGHC